MPLEIGEIVGDYEVIGVLGQGGMGFVYKVRNVISERVEAMKVLLPNLLQESGLAERFLREIKVLAKLDHPNITTLRTAFRAKDQLWMVMELVEGSTLEAILSSGRPAVEEAVRYTAQALDALSYAHQMGVVHRDLKPANIILTPKGVVKITDFGIARDAAETRLTATGAAIGSLLYMSPEQIQRNEVDARSDIYSLGITLYELLTGKLPFSAESEFAIMSAHVVQPPRPPVELNPAIQPHLSAVILRSLAKSPLDRFQNALEFRDALLQSTTSTRVAVPDAAPQAPAAKRRPGVWAAALGAAAVALAGAFLYWQKPASTPSPTPQASQSPEAKVAAPAVIEKKPQPRPAGETKTTVKSAPAVQDPVQKEWESLASTRDVNALKEFRERNPSSPYAQSAFRRIQEVQWETARDSHDPARLRQYRDNHPSSPFTPLAVAEADRLDRAGVTRGMQDALDRFQAACAARDIDALRAVWPSLSGQRLKAVTAMLRNSSKVEFKFERVGEPQIAGDVALLTVRHSRSVTNRSGTYESERDDVVLTLRKSGSVWVITNFPPERLVPMGKKK